MTKWIPYNGSTEQIAEISKAKNCPGYLLRLKNGTERASWDKYELESGNWPGNVKEYWICNPHPLADMIIRQCQTGQPVWIKYSNGCLIEQTTQPRWNIPGAEYSFSSFEKDHSFTKFEEVGKCT